MRPPLFLPHALALALALDFATACNAEPFTDLPTIVGIRMDVDLEALLDEDISEDAVILVMGRDSLKVLTSLNLSFRRGTRLSKKIFLLEMASIIKSDA